MSDFADLWDWRRAIADLYGAVRRDDDPRRAHAMWQAERRRLFTAHPQSAIDEADRAGYAGPFVHDYNPALRLLPTLVPLSGRPVDRVDTGADGTIALHPFARTDGVASVLGGELTLYWIGGYGGGVFLPFADPSNGKQTYGGGRYLLDTIKGADLGTTTDGRIVLDFNFAYFPSCAYSPRYVCPLAPAENRLPSSVLVGERHGP
jgi:uncharacterized protein (DUF1684 family)